MSKITCIRRHHTWRSMRLCDPSDSFKYSSFNIYSTGGGEFLLALTGLCRISVWSATMENRHRLQHFANGVIIDAILQSVEWINTLFDLPDIGSEGGMSGADIYARAMMIQSDNLIRFEKCRQKIVADWFCYNNSARALLVLPVDQHTHQLQWERRDIVALGIARCDYDSLLRYDENLTTATRWMLIWIWHFYISGWNNHIIACCILTSKNEAW